MQPRPGRRIPRQAATLLALATLVALASDAPPAAANHGAAPAPGYVAIDNTQGVAANFINIATSGAAIAVGDESLTNIAFPAGFTFDFYDRLDQTGIQAAGNGFLSFGLACPAADGFCYYQGEDLSTAGTNYVLAPFWVDLNSQCPTTTASLRQQTAAAAPPFRDRIQVVQWSSISLWVSDPAGLGAATVCGKPLNTFQAQLFEGTDIVEFHYQMATNQDDSTQPAGYICYAAGVGVRGSGTGLAYDYNAATPDCLPTSHNGNTNEIRYTAGRAVRIWNNNPVDASNQAFELLQGSAPLAFPLAVSDDPKTFLVVGDVPAAAGDMTGLPTDSTATPSGVYYKPFPQVTFAPAPAFSGSTQFRYRVNDGKDAPQTATVTFNVFPPVVAAIEPALIETAVGTSVGIPFAASGGKPGLTCAWSADGGAPTFVGSTCAGTSVSFAQPGDHVVTVTASDSWVPAQTASDSVIVRVHPLLDVDIVESDVAGTVGTPVELTSAVTGGKTPYVCTWTALTGEPSLPEQSCAGAQFTFTAPGTYTVRLTAFDSLSPSQTGFDEANVTIEQASDSTPPDPGTLSAAGLDLDTIALSWTGVGDDTAVTSIQVHEGPPGFAMPGAVLHAFAGNPVTATGFLHEGLAPGTQHCYRLRVGDGIHTADSPAAVCASTGTPDDTDPTAPGELQATAVSGTRVDLTWIPSTDPVGTVSYQAFRALAPGVTAASIPVPGAPSCTPTLCTLEVTSLAGGTLHHFRVRAIDNNGNVGPWSNEASAATPDQQGPAAPASLGAHAIGSSAILLTWPAVPDADADAYQVFRRMGLGVSPADTLVATLDVPCSTNPCSHDDLGLQSGTLYSYLVRAVDAIGNPGSPSPSAAATTGQGSTGQVGPFSGATLVAEAGPALTVQAGEEVELDGSGADGATASRFQWVQVEGPTISVRGAESAVLQFAAPSPAGQGATLRFRLTIYDARGATASDEVTVTVAGGPATPSVAPSPAPSPAPSQPPAPAPATIQHDAEGLAVAFSAANVPPEALVAWEFGDGATSNEAAPEHEYAQPGQYTVRLTVTPAQGEPTTITRQVTVAADPAPADGPAAVDGTGPSTTSTEAGRPWLVPALAAAGVLLAAAAAVAAWRWLRKPPAPATRPEAALPMDTGPFPAGPEAQDAAPDLEG